MPIKNLIGISIIAAISWLSFTLASLEGRSLFSQLRCFRYIDIYHFLMNEENSDTFKKHSQHINLPDCQSLFIEYYNNHTILCIRDHEG